MATPSRAIAPDDEDLDPAAPPRVTVARPTVRPADVFDFRREPFDPRKFTNPAVRRMFAGDIDRAEKASHLQRREDEANAADAERAKIAQAKAAAKAQEDARKAEVQRVNAANEAAFRTAGVENYTDSYGVIQPVRHEDGRVRFNVGEDGFKVVRQGKDPATGNHYKIKIDAYGDQHVEDANQYNVFDDEPNVVYRGGPEASKKPGDRTGWEKFAPLDDAAEADSPALRAAALTGKSKLKERLLQTALGEAERERIQADLGLEQWRNQRSTSQQRLKQIEDEATSLQAVAQEKAGGFLGFGKDSTPNAEQAKQRIAALQAEAQQLREQVGDVTSEDAAIANSPEATALMRKRSTRASEIEAFRKLVDTEGDVLAAARKFRDMLPEAERKTHPILAAVAAEKQRLGLREPTDPAATPEEREKQLAAWEQSPDPGVQQLAKRARELDAKAASLNGTGIVDQAQRMQVQQQLEAESDKLQKDVESTYQRVQDEAKARQTEQAKAFADKRVMEANGLLGARLWLKENQEMQSEKLPPALQLVAKTVGLRDVMDPGPRFRLKQIEDRIGGPDMAPKWAEHAQILDQGRWGVSPATREFIVSDSVYSDPQKLGALRRDIREKKIPGLQSDGQVAEALDLIDQQAAAKERASIEQARKLPGWAEAEAAAGPGADPAKVFAKWKSSAGSGEIVWNAARKLGGGAVGLLESAVGGANLWARDKVNAVAEWAGADWAKSSPGDFADVISKWMDPKNSLAGAIGGRPNPRLDGVLSQASDTVGQQLPGMLAAFILSRIPGGKGAAATAAMAASILSGVTYGLQNAGSNYSRIFESMVTRDESGAIIAGGEEAHQAAMTAFLESFAVGVSELAPLQAVFAKIPMTGMLEMTGHITKNLAAEITQEVLATKLNNVITLGHSGGAAQAEELSPESIMAMTLGMGAVIAPAVLLKGRKQAQWMTRNAAGIKALEQSADDVPAAWQNYTQTIAPTPEAVALGALSPTDPEITAALQQVKEARAAAKAAKSLEEKVAATQNLHAVMSQHAPTLDRILNEGERSAQINEAAGQIAAISQEGAIARMQEMGIPPEQAAQFATPQYIQRQKDRAAGLIKLANGRKDLLSKAEEMAVTTDHLGNKVELVYDHEGAPIIEERARQALIKVVPAAQKLFPATEVERKAKAATEKKAAETAKQAPAGAAPAAPTKPTVAPAPMNAPEESEDQLDMSPPAGAAPGVTTSNAIDPATFNKEQQAAVNDFGVWLIDKGVDAQEAAAIANEFTSVMPPLAKYNRAKNFVQALTRLGDFAELRGWRIQADGSFAKAAGVATQRTAQNGKATISSALRALATKWDTVNRSRRAGEWFEGGKANEKAIAGFNESLAAGGSSLQAHGMAKESTLGTGIQNLLNLLNNGLDPNRRGGQLDTAPLIGKPGEGLIGATASGTAYTDGPFILVAKPGQSLSGNLSGLGAVLINEAHPEITPELLAAIQTVRPDVLVGSYADAGAITKQLLANKSSSTQSQRKGEPVEAYPAEVAKTKVADAIKEDMAKHGVEVTYVEKSPEEQGGMAYSLETGKILIDVGRITRELQNLPEAKHAERLKTQFNEEVVHAIQMRAAKAIHVKHAKPGEAFVPFLRRYYGDMWKDDKEFSPEVRAAIQKLRGSTDKAGRDDWKLALEGIRMLVQQRASGTMSEEFSQWVKDLGAKTLETLRAMLAVLKRAAANDKAIGEQVKADIAAIESIMAEGAKDSSTGITEAFAGMAKGITNGLYQGLYDALVAGKDTFSGVKDPVLKEARQAFDAGLIKSPEDLKKWVDENEAKKDAAKEKAKSRQTKQREGLEKAVAKNEAKKERAAKKAAKTKEKLPEPTSDWNPDDMASGSLSSAALTGNPGFYSKLERSVEATDFGQTNAKAPEQWIAFVKRQGVQADELKWSGIVSWLETQKAPLTKAQVLDYVRTDGAVRFEEVRAGDMKGEVGRLNNALAGTPYTAGSSQEEPDEVLFWNEDDGWLEFGELPDDIQARLQPVMGQTREPAKYQKYALPGGENYREVVLAMPGKTRPAPNVVAIVVRAGTNIPIETKSIPRGEQEAFRASNTAPGREVVFREPAEVTTQEARYTSSHFPNAPGYVAHYRAQDFGDGTLIEELQSDRHQAARKKGYRDEKAKAHEQAFKDAGEKAYNANETRLEWMRRWRLQNKFPEQLSAVIRLGAEEKKRHDDLMHAHPEYQRLTKAKKEADAAFGELNSIRDNLIPDAPYRDAPAWSLALFKRALREAVETGKEWIGWPAGSVVVDRFDLSKQVDAVRVMRSGAGYSIAAKRRDDAGTIFDTIAGDVPEAKLEDYVGKDLAAKIVNDGISPGNSKDYSGVDLKVGGEGMRAFYDQMVPSAVNKFVKQWGAKVERGGVSVGKPEAQDSKYWAAVNQVGGRQLFSTKKEARDFVDQNTGWIGVAGPGVAPQAPIWRIAITPEMRKSVQEQGLSLFSAPVAKPTKAEAAFNFTVATSRNRQVAKLLEEGRWDEVHRLNEIAVKHAMSDLPGVTARLEPVVGRFQGPADAEAFQEPASRVVVTYKDDGDLGAIRARMADLAQLWDQDEFHELSPTTVTPATVIGVTQADGTSAQPMHIIETGDLSGDEVGALARESGISGMSLAPGKVYVYNVGPFTAEFKNGIAQLIAKIGDRRGVPARHETSWVGLRRYGRESSVSEGIIGYEDSRLRSPEQAGALNRLRTALSRRIPELTQRIFAAPEARSFFTKKDVTPRQVELQKRIADVFETLPDNDLSNPLVQRAYEELNRDLVTQYDILTAGPDGLRFFFENYFRPDPLTGERIGGDLYASSKDAVRDLRERRMLRVLKTDETAFGPEGADFSAHPLLRDSGRTDAEGTPLNYNDVLRAVHDALAHGMFADQFGAIGEEAAWNVHLRTIDNPWSRWALTTETRGQNSWVNYGPQMRDQDGQIRQPGQPGYLTPQDRSFARQKAALLPLEFTLTGDAEVDAPTLRLMDELGADARGSAEKTLSGAAVVLKKIEAVLSGEEAPPALAKSKSAGGVVRAIAKHFHQMMSSKDAIEYTNPDKWGKTVPAAGTRVADILVKATERFPEFISWYEERVKMALQIFGDLDPDTQRPRDKFALRVLLAVTSNGNKVKEQTEDTWRMYKHWKETGKLAGVQARGTRAEAIDEHLRLVDRLVDKFGWEKVDAFLMRTGTVQELRAALVADFGFSKTTAARLTTGELIDEQVPFALVFGAKLGSFFNNLSGNFDTTTMDRWFMRTFGRTMRNQLRRFTKAETDKKRQRLNDAIAAYEAQFPDRQAMIDAGVRKGAAPDSAAELLADYFTDKATRDAIPEDHVLHDVRRAANALYKVSDGYDLVEAPRSGLHRRWIRLVMADAIAKLEAATGKKMSAAEAQAILWYYEKDVHDHHGSKQRDKAPDYASAVNAIYRSERGGDAPSFRESTALRGRGGKPGGSSGRNRRAGRDAGQKAAGLTNSLASASLQERMGALPTGEGPVLSRVDIRRNGNVPTVTEVRDAISSDKQAKVGAPVKPGTNVGLRLDIPAFERTLAKPVRPDGNPTFIVAVHEKWEGKEAGRAGSPISYLPKARITGPLRFMVNERAAQAIMGGKPKSTIATVEGEWAKDQSVPKDIDTWTQAGMNPRRHSYFYDRATGRPVIGGSEAISIGNTVFVKDPEFGSADDFLFSSSITPAQDAEYLAAVERGDNETVKRLVQAAYSDFVYSHVAIPVGNEVRYYPVTYLRFGDVPTNDTGQQVRSTGFNGGVREKGVSVIGAWFDPNRGKYLLPSGSEQADAGIGELVGQERPVYVVKGKTLKDVGSDGEPLLEPGSVEVIKKVALSELVEENNPYETLDGEEYDPGIPGSVDSYHGGEVKWWRAEGIPAPSVRDVVRDAAGNVIPLSQRFNESNDSILYSAPATPPTDSSKLGTWAQSPLRAVGVPESALNRGIVALARWAGNKAKEGARAISLPAAVTKLAGSGAGQYVGQAARIVQEQLLPKTLVPREVAAWILETRAAIGWSARVGEDLMETIKKGGESKLVGGFIVPDAGKSSDVQRTMARYFRGEIPIDDVPEGVRDWAKQITKLWDDRGRKMVDAGIMSWEAYSARRSGDNRYFPHLYVEDEMNQTGVRWASRKLKMFLDRVKPQLSTAWYIYEKNPVDGTAMKDKFGVPKLVEHATKQWRFNSAKHRDEWFKDFVRQETVKRVRARGIEFTADDLTALALQSKETQALVSALQGEIRARYGMGEPTDMETLERAGLITNLSYVVPKSLAQMDHDIALAKLFRDIADNPAYTADVQIAGFKEIPNDRRYGKLAGKWVDGNIYQELIDLGVAPSFAAEIYDRALAKWKMWKTVYNPSTHFRNVLGNLFFADLAGVGVHGPQAVANWRHYRDAWKAIHGNLDEAPLQEMYESGLLGGDYASAELQSALSGIPFEDADGKPKNPMDVMMSAPWRMAKGIGAKMSGAYELEDSIPKVAAYLKARRGGMSVPEAVAHVRKWFPFYDQVGRSATIRATKRLASPFLSFMQEAVRIGGAAMMEKPITFAKWMAIPGLISQISRLALGLDDEDWEAVTRDLNGQAFGMPMFSALMPITDSKGNLAQWDFSNVIPYADMLGQRMGESQDKPMWASMIHKYFLSGPLTQLAIAWGQGRDPFTGKDFKQTDMTNAEALGATAMYTGKLLLPPLTPGIGTSNPVSVVGGPDRTGRFMQERSRTQEAARKFVGIDVKGAEPNLFKSADEFRKANGLPQPPEFNDSTAKSRIRKEVYDALVQSDVAVLAEKLVELRERAGDTIATAQDINRLFYYRRPDAIIARKDDREAWKKTLAPREREVLDKANAEFERVRRNAMQLIRQAEALKPELKAPPSRKPLTTASIFPTPGPRPNSPAGMMSRQAILPV